MPCRNPFHIRYVAAARAFMNTRERYWQSSMNLIHTDGLNDSKDFNNLGFFRRNTSRKFIEDFQWFSTHYNFSSIEVSRRNDLITAKKLILAKEMETEVNKIEELELFSIIVIEKEALLYEKQNKDCIGSNVSLTSESMDSTEVNIEGNLNKNNLSENSDITVINGAKHELRFSALEFHSEEEKQSQLIGIDNLNGCDNQNDTLNIINNNNNNTINSSKIINEKK